MRGIGIEKKYSKGKSSFYLIHACRRSEFENRFSSIFEPNVTCAENKTCTAIDMNMNCDKETKTCACNMDMRWNNETAECQVYIDVDCSGFQFNETAMNTTKETLNNTARDDDGIKEAVKFVEDKKLQEVNANDTLKDSALAEIDVDRTTEDELDEEFCREVYEAEKRFQVRFIIVLPS